VNESGFSRGAWFLFGVLVACFVVAGATSARTTIVPVIILNPDGTPVNFGRAPLMMREEEMLS